jgi:Domain of Unknown Function (DUF1080)
MSFSLALISGFWERGESSLRAKVACHSQRLMTRLAVVAFFLLHVGAPQPLRAESTSTLAAAAAPIVWQAQGHHAVQVDGWKAVSLAHEPAWRLYHVAMDPSEQKDLALAEPTRLADLVVTSLRNTHPVKLADWASGIALPASEKARPLFDGVSLDGWTGHEAGVWSVEPGVIRAATSAALPASTYLFHREEVREFRLLFEVKQTMGPEFSTMHSAVGVLGERFTDAGDAHGFKGPLVMFCHDWGIWDAHGRNRVVPANATSAITLPAEKPGEWNQIELLVLGDRLRCVANGHLVFDFTETPGRLKKSPLGLQLHGRAAKQEYRFRGLILSATPEGRLMSLKPGA